MNNFINYDHKKISGNYFNSKHSSFLLSNYNLLYIIINSYKNFFKYNLKEIFNFIFPIYIHNSNFIIEFKNYSMLYPLKSHYYCINKGITYSTSIKVKFLIYYYFFDKNGKIIKKKLREDIIIIPSIPYITNNTSFVINGIEKIVISKFIRSPGIYFILENNKHILRLVPDKGEELDFIIDSDNFLYLKSKKNYVYLTDILKSYGLNNKEIINHFYDFLEVFHMNSNWYLLFNPEVFLNFNLPFDIKNKYGETVVKKNIFLDSTIIEKLKINNIKYILIDKTFVLNKELYCNIYFNNLKLASSGDVINDSIILNILKNNINSFKIIILGSSSHKSILNTLKKKCSDFFFSNLTVNNFLKSINFKFFDFNTVNINFDYFKKIFLIYPICRKKINFFYKKNFNFNFLNIRDIINISKLIISFKDGKIKPTDRLNISDLNMFSVGEYLNEIFFNFFFNTKKNVENAFVNLDKFNLNSFLKVYNLVLCLKKFFSVSKYCQFLDQLNILSELSHKRRVTFIGVVGISKKYSGFNSRYLGSSHYSRICPVETPEGINIGLVSSLALLCRVDKHNFLIAPYYKFLNGKILNKWVYLSVEEESLNFINEPTNHFESFDNIDFLLSKYGDQMVLTNSKLIKYTNILTYQMLSLSPLLIPFIENNDSNRALMASNMIRQALPLMFLERPFISTGLESLVGSNSNTVLFCKDKSRSTFTDSRLIILKKYLSFKDFYFYNYNFYFLIKYFSSNQKTIISQRILNKKYNFSGDVISDGSCTLDGNFSIGKNVLVAIMCWEGYNFEDSVIVSEKLIFDDKFTSLDLFQIDINVIKIFNKFEFITNEIIKNKFSEKNLNDFGIIKVGSIVYGGDIILGKVAPIINDFEEIDPNHRLLYSIFSNNNFNTRDTSFYLPKSFTSGVVISTEVYFSERYNLNSNDNNLLNYQVKMNLKFKKKKNLLIKNKLFKMMKNFLINKRVLIKNSVRILNKNHFYKKKISDLLDFKFVDDFNYNMYIKIKKKIIFFLKINKFLKKNLKINYIKNLTPDLVKLVRIKIISKKKLQVGDKMSGRYGNKGVISKILPSQQMPYLFNGKIIDVILNPLGIPSRMNIGQLLEVHMGFISFSISMKIKNILTKNNFFKKIKILLSKIYNYNFGDKKKILDLFDYKKLLHLINYFNEGFYFSVEPFSNFNESKMNDLLDIIFSDNFLNKEFLFKNKKQVYLRDGRNSELFDNPVTIGFMYIFKLNHLSEEKLSYRSVGPYSLITQQPLKGKSNKGGQRLGEMEAWAIEAYGAFYSLQEMFTIKSDDILGRFESYKNIVKGITKFVFNKPESFDIMLKNINSLLLYIRFNDY